MKHIMLKICEKKTTTDIFIGNSLFSNIAQYLKKNHIADKYVIISDSNTKRLFGNNLLTALKKSRLDTIILSFPQGEKNKSRKTKANIEDKMLSLNIGRDSAILALGGGVVGDLAGFIAGTYMRGIPIVQVPTTTMAQADSSIGGKTAIDVPAGKNLLGVFHNPTAVFIDIGCLKTLDNRNYISGLVEVIKHGLIRDESFYNFLKDNVKLILYRKDKNNKKDKRYNSLMETLMAKNLSIKRDIVIKDNKESNLRKILNYGHTIGHAIEKLSSFKLLHGEAIAIGISVEAFISYKLGISSEKTFLDQISLFQKLGLPTSIPKNISTRDIMISTLIDKKSRKGLPEFALIKKIGSYATFKDKKVTMTIEPRLLVRYIEEYRSLYN